jgi:hypothetical protein
LAPVSVWYRLQVTILYDEQARNVTSQPLLLSIPPVKPKNYILWEEGDAPCVAQNKATLSRMAAQVAIRSDSVEAAIRRVSGLEEERSQKPVLYNKTAPSVSKMATPSINDPIKIFFSYAREDETLVKRLDEQLAVLQRRNLITNWHTGKIALGKVVKQEMLNHLLQAHIILLLISPRFMVSQYHIIEGILKQEHAHKPIIVPVLLRPTANWKDDFFGALQVIPRNERPITSWPKMDAAFAQVAEEIIEAVKMLKKKGNM